MPAKVLEQTDTRIRVVLEGVDQVYASALRRLAISEVPTMAIDDVVILENTSAMYDEVLAHRLGFIPLTTDLQRYVLPEECDCKSALGCNRCRVLLVLDAEARDTARAVHSKELVSEDAAVRPVSESIPIVKLAPGQKVKLEAYARLGKGRDHAKWQAATISVLTPYRGHEGAYLLTIESTGALQASEILLKAAEILGTKLAELAKEAGEKG